MIIDIRPTPVRVSNPLHIFKQHKKRNKKFHNSKIPIVCNNKQQFAQTRESAPGRFRFVESPDGKPVGKKDLNP